MKDKANSAKHLIEQQESGVKKLRELLDAAEKLGVMDKADPADLDALLKSLDEIEAKDRAVMALAEAVIERSAPKEEKKETKKAAPKKKEPEPEPPKEDKKEEQAKEKDEDDEMDFFD